MSSIEKGRFDFLMVSMINRTRNKLNSTTSNKPVLGGKESVFSRERVTVFISAFNHRSFLIWAIVVSSLLFTQCDPFLTLTTNQSLSVPVSIVVPDKAAEHKEREGMVFWIDSDNSGFVFVTNNERWVVRVDSGTMFTGDGFQSVKDMYPDQRIRLIYSIKDGIKTAHLVEKKSIQRIVENDTTIDTSFPVPDILIQNVHFWTKIYTEISMNERLVHDKRYPGVIYGTVTKDFFTGAIYNSMVKKRNQLVTMLHNIRAQPDSLLNEEELEIARLFEEYAPEGAILDAEEHIRFQRGVKERFMWGLMQSTAYMDTIRAIFKSYGVPMRLTYLPHVESSFDLFARSHVGALGMWQFMPATGRDYLQINDFVDQRRDPIQSTIAAAKLLKHNHEKLESWPLAVTAYNCGVRTMKSAVAIVKSDDLGEIIKKYDNPWFGFASSNFYSCFIAASQIGQNPSEYFEEYDSIVEISREKLAIRSITLLYPTRLSDIYDVTSVNEWTFRLLNPGFEWSLISKLQAIPAGYTIHLPDTVSLPNIEITHRLSPEMTIYFENNAYAFQMLPSENIASGFTFSGIPSLTNNITFNTLQFPASPTEAFSFSDRPASSLFNTDDFGPPIIAKGDNSNILYE